MKGIIRIDSGDIPTLYLVFDEKNKVMFCYLRFVLVFFLHEESMLFCDHFLFHIAGLFFFNQQLH